MPFHDEDASIQSFYDDIDVHHLQPLWALHGLMQPCPPRAAVPTHWSGGELTRLARRSGELIGFDRGGDRRVLSLSNPGLAPKPFATATLWGAIQYLGPGECAPAHRHSPAAIRFVLVGSGVDTVVDGTPVPMEPGDLIITPAGCWHEHRSAGTGEMMWFDGLDLALIAELDAMFFDPPKTTSSAQGQAPQDGAPQNSSVRPSVEHLRLISPGLHAVSHHIDTPTPAPAGQRTRFAWADIDAALTASLDEGVARVRCTKDGSDVMATLRCEFVRIEAGRSFEFAKRAESNIIVVFTGDGSCTLTGQRDGNDGSQKLARFDCVALPTYTATTVTANETLTLFVLSDAPVLIALGIADVAKRLERVG